MTLLLCGSAHAIKDSNGKESTQYILDYKTGEKKYFECETYEQLRQMARKELGLNRTVTTDKTGTTVEWCIDNAMFSNYVYRGNASVVEDEYFWEVRYGTCPSSYSITPEGGMYPSGESCLLPGWQEEFRLMDNASMDDVKVSVLSVETTDIGDCRLIGSWAYPFDRKPNKTRSEDKFMPEKLFNIVYSKSDLTQDMLFNIDYLFGQYDPSSWNLKAVTHIKYHIANAVPAHGIPGESSGLFNEDRVWTYDASSGSGLYPPRLIKMKFDGTTQYDGREYHNFVNCYYGWYKFKEDDTCTITELSRCPSILVREEDGRVFARIPQEYLYAGSESIVFDPETGLSNEVQLYDFRCPVGESFDGVFGMGEVMRFTVTGESTVEVGGESLRKIRVKSDGGELGIPGEWDVVENLGVVSGNGFFAFFNAVVIAGSRSTMLGAGHHVELRNVADTDGNILYRGTDTNLPDPGYGLFREDRVWTYHSSHIMSPLAYEVKMGFDGTTEYEGRTYHKFTNTSYYCTTEEKELTPCEPILVRADHGKVFARLPKGVYVAPTECLQYDAGTGLSEEVQLYDFRCPVGETFKTINNVGEVTELKVLSEGTVMVDGKPLRKITAGYADSNHSAERYTAGHEIIENIGFTSGDTFFAYINNLLADGYVDPTYMVGCAQGISLSRYGTSDGRTLYRPYVRPLLSYDKMWEYFGYEIDNNHSDVYPEGKTDCRLSRYVTGQNKTVGDRIYTELILDGVTSWVIPYPTYNFTDPGTGVETEKVGNCVALLREEGGKVWMLLQGETVQYTAVPYKEVWTRPVTENEEVLLYDFNAGQGTVVDGWFNNVLAPAVVRYVDDLTNTGGTELWKFNLANDRPDPSWSVENGPAVYIDVNYVEGVGNIGDGNLTELWSQSPYDPVPTCICGSGEFFNNLYDRQGNLLQGGRGIKAPETQGVGGVTDETDGDGARYDLFGRRIREAARGQVYILNVRKYVGR